MAEKLTPAQELTMISILNGEGRETLRAFKKRIDDYDMKLIAARNRGASGPDVQRAESEILQMRRALNSGIAAHDKLLWYVQAALRTVGRDYTPQLASGMGALPLILGMTIYEVIAVVVGIYALSGLITDYNNQKLIMAGKEPIVNDLLSKIVNPKTVEGIAGGISTIAIVAAVGFALYIGWQVMKKKELV